MIATLCPKSFPRRVACLTFALAIVMAACRESAGPEKKSDGEIVVSAAASLQDAFGEIARRFQGRTGVKVDFNFGSSGELEKQIEFGAPADVFASAGAREMDALESKGLMEAGSRRDFAANELVLIAPTSSTAPLKGFADLAGASIQRIAIGNPRTVPAGHYAQQALESTGLWDKVSPRLILAENVRQVLEYTAHGEVDAGLVYSTDVAVARGRVNVVARAPEGTYGPVRYPIAVVKTSRHAAPARQFAQFVLSPGGQAVLRQYGFVPVK